jgi:PAS domain S-box
MSNAASQINNSQKSDILADLREAFFNNAQETFVLFDKDFNIIDVNEAFVRALHLRREDVVGKNVTEISPVLHKQNDIRSISKCWLRASP